MLFQQVAEAANRGLVRHRLLAQIDADKLPHRGRFIERFFNRRIYKMAEVAGLLRGGWDRFDRRLSQISVIQVDAYQEKCAVLPVIQLWQYNRTAKKTLIKFRMCNQLG